MDASPIPRRLFVLAVAATVLGAACGGDEESAIAESTPSPSVSESTQTAEETASPAPAVSRPPSPAGGRRPTGSLDAESAALGLYRAWQSGDRDDAATWATQQAIAELWGYPANPMEFSSPCQELEDRPGIACFFYYEGGGLNMIVEDSDGRGFFVTDIFFVAD